MTRRSNSLVFALLSALPLLFAAPATFAAYVDAVDPTCGGRSAVSPCYSSIQAAVNGEPDGAVIIVRPGHYVEDFWNDPSTDRSSYPGAIDIHGLWMYKNFQVVESIDNSATDGSADTIVESPEPWNPYGAIRISGTGNTLAGFKIIDATDERHLTHSHVLVKVEGDNNSVFDNIIYGRGPAFREDRAVLVQGERFSTGNGDGLAYFNNVKRNEIYWTCYGVDLSDAEQARLQDDAGIACNYIHDTCKNINLRISCDLIDPLLYPDEIILRPIANNYLGAHEFGSVQIEYGTTDGSVPTCNPPVDASNNYWGTPAGPTLGNPDPTQLPTDLNADLIGWPYRGSAVTFSPWLTIPDVCAPSAKARIGDRVWLDTDGNGQQDAGEAGLARATVNIYACADGIATGSAIGSTLTDGNGHYVFSVAPGTYALEFMRDANGAYNFSPRDAGDDAIDSDADQTTGRTTCVTLVSGQSDLTWDAGFVPPRATVSDFVWNDLNGDGRQDAGEPGLPGVGVELHRCADASLVAGMTTDAAGTYSFTADAGSYYVQFAAPAGFVFSPLNAAIAGPTSDSNANPATGATACVAIAAGANEATLDAGLFRKGALGDLVWRDSNGNGVQDATERGVPGVTVNLLGCDGASALASTTTDGSGRYAFNVDPGSYVVQIVAPAGDTFSQPNQGFDKARSSAVDPATGKTSCVTLASGQVDTTRDAGLLASTPRVTPICRSANFWQDHSSSDGRSAARNIVQGIINSVPGGLAICGQTLTSTNVKDIHSALEGMCVKGYDQRQQLARQLIATSLGCVVSNAGKDCAFLPSIAQTFRECNAACAAGDSARFQGCVDALDCANNGGTWSRGRCQGGTTASGGGYGARYGGRSEGATGCETAPLRNPDNGLNFEPVGPASNANSCTAARQSSCTIFGCN